MSRIFRIFSIYFFYVLVCRLDKAKFLRSKGMRIGKNCHLVNALTDYGSEPYLIEMENNVTVAGGVFFLTHDAASRLFRDRIPGASKFGNRFGRILVRDNCFIGAGSIILPNVEIGPNSIVGAGSVVTKWVPPNSVVAGNPSADHSHLG